MKFSEIANRLTRWSAAPAVLVGSIGLVILLSLTLRSEPQRAVAALIAAWLDKLQDG